jgi:hypothetical protein
MPGTEASAEEAGRTVTTIASPGPPLARHLDGFYFQVAKDKKWA